MPLKASSPPDGRGSKMRPVACYNLAQTDTAAHFWAMERLWAEVRGKK